MSSLAQFWPKGACKQPSHSFRRIIFSCGSNSSIYWHTQSVSHMCSIPSANQNKSKLYTCTVWLFIGFTSIHHLYIHYPCWFNSNLWKPFKPFFRNCRPLSDLVTPEEQKIISDRIDLSKLPLFGFCGLKTGTADLRCSI